MNWLKSIFRPVRRIIQARYNSASMSESSQKNFAGADYYSADAAMQRHIRLLIAVRARNEFANNSFAYGIISTLADDTVGTGPRLQLENDESLANISDAKAVSLQHIERRFVQLADRECVARMEWQGDHRLDTVKLYQQRRVIARSLIGRHYGKTVLPPMGLIPATGLVVRYPNR